MDELRVFVNPTGNDVLVKTMVMEEYVDKGFHYTLKGIQSVIDLVKARGSEEFTFLFYTDKQIQVIIDDAVDKRQQDTAVYEFEQSDLLKEWKAVLETSIDQKQFINFLKKRDPEKELPETEALIASLQTLKLASEIRFDGDYDDRNNYNFAIKVKDMEGNTKLPNLLTINIPLINESDFALDMEIELEVIKPKGEGEKPWFKLACPKFDRYWKQAVKHEIEVLKKALPDYHILAGTR